MPVYPRVCGGSAEGWGRRRHSRGLSPRVRGKPLGLGLGFAALPRRSIPACAGEAAERHHRGGKPGVYPRVCGGSWDAMTDERRAEGLSPRVRGKPIHQPPVQPPSRSIPACAGEAAPHARRPIPARVYPRVCGGSNRCHAYDYAYVGLSPRVRGKPPLASGDNNIVGSIPACAGEARASPIDQPPARVYPRVCGGSSWQESVK